MIRRLVLERVQLGGYEPRPNPHDGLSDSTTESSSGSPIPRYLEMVLIGVSVTVFGALLCSCLGIGSDKNGGS